MEPIFLHDGTLMQVHDERACIGPHCVIHNPSDHPLNTAPLLWRSDRRLMERICEHGVGHPDPDGLLADSMLGLGDESRGIHGCDGCCTKSD